MYFLTLSVRIRMSFNYSIKKLPTIYGAAVWAAWESLVGHQWFRKLHQLQKHVQRFNLCPCFFVKWKGFVCLFCRKSENSKFYFSWIEVIEISVWLESYSHEHFLIDLLLLPALKWYGLFKVVSAWAWNVNYYGKTTISRLKVALKYNRVRLINTNCVLEATQLMKKSKNWLENSFVCRV